MKRGRKTGAAGAAGSKRRKKNPSIQHLAGTSKRKVKRAPPEGYVCNICKAPGHWVYLCSAKAKAGKEGAESSSSEGVVSSSEDDGPLEPSATAASSPSPCTSNPRKVFISGLPFSFAEADIEKLCGSDLMAGGLHTIESLKMHRFSGSRRCNGQAFVTYTTAEGAQACMRKLHGKTIKCDKGIDLRLTAVPAVSKKQATLKKKKPKLDSDMVGRATYIYEGQGAVLVVD